MDFAQNRGDKDEPECAESCEKLGGLEVRNCGTLLLDYFKKCASLTSRTTMRKSYHHRPARQVSIFGG